MLGVGLLAILAWFGYTSYLNRVERRLAAAEGPLPRARGRAGHARAGAARARDPPHRHAARSRGPRGRARGAGPRHRRAARAGCSTSTTGSAWWTSTSSSCAPRASGGSAPSPPSCWAGSATPRRCRRCSRPCRPPGPRTRDVREIALRALARIADPRAVEPLIESLKTAEVWLAPAHRRHPHAPRRRWWSIR